MKKMFVFYAETTGASCYAGKYHFIAKDKTEAIKFAKDFEDKHNEMVSSEKYDKWYKLQHTIKFHLDNYYMNSEFELPVEGIILSLCPTGKYKIMSDNVH